MLEEGYCDREQLDKMIDTIHVYGRIPHERVISLLRSMDFSILARPREERYAKAGFPTKSVEAMINSVAMLCNFTSDLDRYLRHKENAFIFENETVEAIQQGFVGVAELSADEIVAIRKAARKTAEENFDYRLYIETMKEFLGAR